MTKQSNKLLLSTLIEHYAVGFAYIFKFKNKQCVVIASGNQQELINILYDNKAIWNAEVYSFGCNVSGDLTVLLK